MRPAKREAAKATGIILPTGKDLERLQSLCALAKAHARAKTVGALTVPGTRKPRPPRKPNIDHTYKKLEARFEMMIELETRWRVAELGVPYTDEIARRFAHFRFDSDHRRKLEALQLRGEQAREELRARAAQLSLPLMGGAGPPAPSAI
jgi:hypothetical protein